MIEFIRLSMFMKGVMKKVIEFLKDPLAFPIFILDAIYIFWRSTTPMDIPRDDNFGNFFAGLKIVAIYIFITILARAVRTNWKWSLLFIVILSPVIYGTALLALAVFSGTELYVWDEGKPVFLVAMLAGTIFPAAALLMIPTYKNRKLSLLLFFAMVPILGGTVAYPLYFYPEKRQEAELEKYDYYIYSVTDWDNHIFHEFLKCPKGSFNCEELAGSYSALWEIYVDQESKEVRLFGMGNRLEYVEGTETHWYGYEGEATLNDITYALQYYEEDGTRRFLLNKCLSEAPESCTTIPLDLSMPQSDDELEGIIENTNTDELYILSEQKIIYVYGEASPGYKYLDSLAVTDFGTYYIYSFTRDNTYSYFLYGCESDYSCWSMPFIFSTVDQEEADLRYDEKTDKLLVTVGDRLIFTYKGIMSYRCYDGWCSDAQCYVEGCKFIEK
jgi:hypothetical protein